MFGMLSPARHSLDYRTTYARCCGHQRRVNGISALPWLSYESVLLYQTAVDCGAVAIGELPRVRCCKLRPLLAQVSDREIGTFCAHVGSLLASIKVEDDLRDGGSIRSRIVAFLYRRRFSATRRYFSRLDPGFSSFVESIVAEHLALECPARGRSLEEYVRPTATAFGYVFGLMAKLSPMSQRAELLRKLGECVGAAIIAFDCAVDRDRDVWRGDFNPLPPGPEAVQEALAFSRSRLAHARSLCAEAFGAKALTVQTLDGVLDRVANVGRRLACPKCAAQMVRSMQNWGLSSSLGAVQFNSLLGLGGLVALAAGLVVKLMSNAPPGPILPIDPNAVVQQPPPALPPPVVPVRPPASTGSTGDCSTSLSCCDGAQCCGESTSCALDNSCDGLDCSGCDGCGDCGSGCSGCDVSC